MRSSIIIVNMNNNNTIINELQFYIITLQTQLVGQAYLASRSSTTTQRDQVRQEAGYVIH